VGEGGPQAGAHEVIVRGSVYKAPIPTDDRRPQDHPVVVIQAEAVTELVATVCVIPLTTAYNGPKLPVHVVPKKRNPFLDRNSTALCHRPVYLEKTVLQRREPMGGVAEEDLFALEAAVRLVWGL
jgi:mRNA-degrading endonuclease toxin of MazEF toxin-antitoxin module